MKTFVLFGITKYGTPRLLSVIQAEDLAKAGELLGGSLSDVGGTERPEFQLYFELGAQCAVFTPGICTPEMLAKASENSSLNVEDLVGHYRYRFQNIFNKVVIGTAPRLG
jgi:hypothetical protein